MRLKKEGGPRLSEVCWGYGKAGLPEPSREMSPRGIQQQAVTWAIDLMLLGCAGGGSGGNTVKPITWRHFPPIKHTSLRDPTTEPSPECARRTPGRDPAGRRVPEHFGCAPDIRFNDCVSQRFLLELFSLGNCLLWQKSSLLQRAEPCSPMSARGGARNRSGLPG